MIKPFRTLVARIRAYFPEHRATKDALDRVREQTAQERDQLHREAQRLRAMLAEERAGRVTTTVRADQVRAGDVLVWMGGSRRDRVESVTVEDGRARIYLGEGYGACIERADQKVKIFTV